AGDIVGNVEEAEQPAEIIAREAEAAIAGRLAEAQLRLAAAEHGGVERCRLPVDAVAEELPLDVARLALRPEQHAVERRVDDQRRRRAGAAMAHIPKQPGGVVAEAMQLDAPAAFLAPCDDAGGIGLADDELGYFRVQEPAFAAADIAEGGAGARFEPGAFEDGLADVLDIVVGEIELELRAGGVARPLLPVEIRHVERRRREVERQARGRLL